METFSLYKVRRARKYQRAELLVLMETSAKTRQEKYWHSQAGDDKAFKQKMGQSCHWRNAGHLPNTKAEFNHVFNRPIQLPVTVTETGVLYPVKIPRAFHA